MTTERKPGTLVFEFKGPVEKADWLVAELDLLGFAAFEEVPPLLRAYIAETDFGADTAERMERMLSELGVSESSRTVVEARNWNARWEAGIQPVQAGPFCVHPPWREPAEGLMPICIEPKMSFGTAHHETTRLVLSMMVGVVGEGMNVLDAGTGTGVLAIAARMLGAESVLAFDIDPWSSENALENLERNPVGGVQVRQGGMESAGEGPFDVILANINREVLLQMMPRMDRLLVPGGAAILSGILVENRESVLRAAEALGWSVESDRSEGAWWALSIRTQVRSRNNSK
jgi:ribosomal protein L11 methyltransferase